MINLIGISGKIGAGKNTVASIICYLLWVKQVEDGTSPVPNLNINVHDFIASPTRSLVETGWEIKSFASKLKQVAGLILGVPPHKFEDRVFKETVLPSIWWKWKITKKDSSVEYFPHKTYFTPEVLGKVELIKMTPRIFLQLLGTECGREVLHPSVWENSLFNEYVCPNCKSDPGSVCFGHRVPNWIISDVRFPNEFQAIKERGGIVINVERKNIGTEEKVSSHASENALEGLDFSWTIENNGSIEELVFQVREILEHFKII